VERERAAFPAHIHAIERERMEMDIQAQRRIAALDERHCADVRVVDARQAELRFRAARERACERTRERRQHLRAERAVVAEQDAQPPRERAHPLTHRHLGKHLIDEVCGGVAHASSDTRWTEPAALAREGYDEIFAALTAA